MFGVFLIKTKKNIPCNGKNNYPNNKNFNSLNSDNTNNGKEYPDLQTDKFPVVYSSFFLIIT